VVQAEPAPLRRRGDRWSGDKLGPVTYVLHAIPASHPCATVERALQLKGLPYRRVELIPVAHKPRQRLRFGETTVPGLEFPDGRRMTGSRAILRALEDHAPELVPADPETRRRVERAEEWGDQVLQPLARRVVWAAVSRRPEVMDDYSASADLPVPRAVARRSAPLVARAARRVNKGSVLNVRADLAHLAHHLDRVDDWIAHGVLGREEPNVGDLQIAPSLALLASVEDLARVFADRPALALARRWFPGYPEGRVPAWTLPGEWLSESASSSAWAAWATGPAAGSSTGA
jgi:glutathione S-transferase